MTTRSERNRNLYDENNSRVARNKELYDKLYQDESYFNNEEPLKVTQLERTNEIDINAVKELLKGREIYRREMKMKELNIGEKKQIEVPVQEEKEEEKKYDINAFLNKASSDRETEPYHKIDPDILKHPIQEEKENDDIELSVEELKDMGTTALSLDIFGDLSATSELDSDLGYEKVLEQVIDDNEPELVAKITQTQFFDDDFKQEIEEDDEDDDEDDFFDDNVEKSSPLVKIIMVLLILVILALVGYLIFM